MIAVYVILASLAPLAVMALCFIAMQLGRIADAIESKRDDNDNRD